MMKKKTLHKLSAKIIGARDRNFPGLRNESSSMRKKLIGKIIRVKDSFFVHTGIGTIGNGVVTIGIGIGVIGNVIGIICTGIGIICIGIGVIGNDIITNGICIIGKSIDTTC